MADTMDPYTVLGVSRSATKNEIKEAFRRLALQLHPDKHSASPDHLRRAASLRFKQVSDAYQVLIDDTRRAGFDHRPPGPAAGGGGHYGYARSHRHAGGRGADFRVSFKDFTSRNFLLNLAFASIIFGVAATADGCVNAVWKMQNSGKSFEDAIDSIERVKKTER